MFIMLLIIKLYIILSAILVDRTCLTKVPVEIGTGWISNTPDGLAEIEDATIRLLTTCYANRDKTIVLIGDHSGRFMKKLSSYGGFSLGMLDSTRRSENIPRHSRSLNYMKKHKVHLVVMTATYYLQSFNYWITYGFSGYRDSTASVMVLGWSPNKKDAPCAVTEQVLDILYNAYANFMLNVHLICRHLTSGITLFTMNPFANQAPSPWELFHIKEQRNPYALYLYARKWQEQDGMCRNLEFDKTLDLGHSEITTLEVSNDNTIINDGNKPTILGLSRRLKLQWFRQLSFIDDFVAYLNATRKYVWTTSPEGSEIVHDYTKMLSMPFFVRSNEFIYNSVHHTYPHAINCVSFVTQFRGYKPTLEKIISIIDKSSLIGMNLVYLVTLMFFKYFLRQPLIEGVLNLCRLFCNSGLSATSSLNAAPQIYIGCLMFFTVTMQGIFQGNLASLLTHNFPKRQANTIQDLAELGYTIHGEDTLLVHFDDPIFEGRLRTVPMHGSCFEDVLRDPSNACIIWTDGQKDMAMQHNLHISEGCIAREYICHMIPTKWFLEEKLDQFLAVKIATDTMMPLTEKVDEQRLVESESQEVTLEPEVMALDELTFAFVILAIGLACASATFAIEIIIDHYRHRISTVEVIVLN